MGKSYMFRSTDAGAPVLFAEAGGLISVLDACLVDGYGTKAGLGWTKEYQNATDDIAVYRMGGGTRRFVQFDHSMSWTPNTQCQAKVTAYESMLDYETGYLPCPVTGEMYLGICNYVNSSYVIDWDIIGDDSGIYLCIGVTRNTERQVNYIGDYLPFNMDNKSNFIMSFSSFDKGSVTVNGWTIRTKNNLTVGMISSSDIYNNRGNFPITCLSGESFSDNGDYLGNILLFDQALPFPLFTQPFFQINNLFAGMFPGLYTPLMPVQVNDVFSDKGGGDIYFYNFHNYYTLETNFLGVLAGEGFRP